MVDLAAIDLGLGIILKVATIILVLILLAIAWNLDKLVKSLERSAESMERTTSTVEDLVKILRKIPFVGGKKDD